ncbi:glycerate kinase type-2 family protein [Anaerotignum sp. MB30-C6]|uniref:glycerate kinase type-2 family protein n=1 Tax=Anaerotignum sp. MB30-C6 TaxID=3070814 RepID=UPI0027DCDF17|nr:glycerate kinase [Anaerotignum sp. MB30-C6]WMI80228.1 glycerate kinase [Anaerotignum sp. MB30-C6]
MGIIKEDAKKIIHSSIQRVLSDSAVKRALEGKSFSGKVVVIAIGKAAWNMANAAAEILGDDIEKGIVLTKYHHSQGPIKNFTVLEASHPLPDEKTITGTEVIIEAVSDLSPEDTVIFLVSGGGSALFEKPAGNLGLKDLLEVTDQLLKCGADIVEMNTIRKHLSAVKGGKFAALCAPAQVYTIALSDILGDRPDSIASGPTCPDLSTCKDAFAIVEKYGLSLTEEMKQQLFVETPKEVLNNTMLITGSVNELCIAAASEAKALGYEPLILSTFVDCEAKEAGRFLAAIGKTIQKDGFPLKAPCAIICGGETVVRITGKGKGGRNQELALSAAASITGMDNIVIGAVGSDGTDGPTDAAGALVDGYTKETLDEAGISIVDILAENDSNRALAITDALVMTGPTGTNVNDLYFLLCK